MSITYHFWSITFIALEIMFIANHSWIYRYYRHQIKAQFQAKRERGEKLNERSVEKVWAINIVCTYCTSRWNTHLSIYRCDENSACVQNHSIPFPYITFMFSLEPADVNNDPDRKKNCFFVYCFYFCFVWLCALVRFAHIS